MNLAHNERIKLSAAALDRASTACFAVGALAPLVGSYAAPSGNHVSVFWVVLMALAWSLAAVALHFLARRVLRGLRE